MGFVRFVLPKGRTGQSWSPHTAEEMEAAKAALASIELSVFMGTPDETAVRDAVGRLRPVG